MTCEELLQICSGEFESNFSQIWADQVLKTGSLPSLWKLIEERNTFALPKEVLQKVEFRSAYILEAVYFKNPVLLTPYLDSFFDVFPTVTNGSMRRHFSKIGYHIIKNGYDPANRDAVATACADWIIDLATRIAVQVWALEILVELARHEVWVKELLSELIALLSKNPSAGLAVRLRKIKSTHLG